ncbi:MAG: hypothetical protein M0Z55_10240, partial [Peptococcaceae bacterium]|nr:hypothetical protein [Peptococcaceae bacterium]
MTKQRWEKAFANLFSQFAGSKGVAPAEQVTQYWIDDLTTKVYLTDKHPDVIAVSLTAGEFAQLLNNRDYLSLDGKVEYHLYTENYRKELEAAKDEANTISHFKKQKIKSRCMGCTLTSIAFNRSRDEAEIIYSIKIVVSEATDKFFKTLNKGRDGKLLDRNVLYEQPYKLNMLKQNGVWKINNFVA